MPQAPRSINHLLQSLPAAEFEALRPHLELGRVGQGKLSWLKAARG